MGSAARLARGLMGGTGPVKGREEPAVGKVFLSGSEPMELESTTVIQAPDVTHLQSRVVKDHWLGIE
jgi:hypothetical protein